MSVLNFAWLICSYLSVLNM